MADENVHIRITLDDRARETLIDSLIKIRGFDCTKEASCEKGDHTRSWPCVLASTDQPPTTRKPTDQH